MRLAKGFCGTLRVDTVVYCGVGNAHYEELGETLGVGTAYVVFTLVVVVLDGNDDAVVNANSTVGITPSKKAQSVESKFCLGACLHEVACDGFGVRLATHRPVK